MTTFLIERYAPGVTRSRLEDDLLRLEAAAVAMGGHDAGLHVVRATFVPDDEACMCLVDAPNRAALHALTDAAAFPTDRITDVHELAAETGTRPAVTTREEPR